MCTREDAANGRGFPSSTNYSYFDFDASVWISVKFRMFRKTPHVNSGLISINHLEWAVPIFASLFTVEMTNLFLWHCGLFEFICVVCFIEFICAVCFIE